MPKRVYVPILQQFGALTGCSLKPRGYIVHLDDGRDCIATPDELAAPDNIIPGPRPQRLTGVLAGVA